VLTTQIQCQGAAQAHGKTYSNSLSHSAYPAGCFSYHGSSHDVYYFNSAASGSSNSLASPVCMDYGWHRVVRTTRNNHNEWGTLQNLIIAANDASEGIYDAIRTVQQINQIKLVRINDSAANVYLLYEPLQKDLLTTIQECGRSTTRVQSSTQWTSGYSGHVVSGNLTGVNRHDQTMNLPYMFICGHNEESDDDHSVLAFTDNIGYEGYNSWGDSWRGTYQYGTVWSLFNADYSPAHQTHIYSSPQAYPGYRGNNPGTYEVYVRQSLSAR
jgi:hypothetical protein